MPSPLPKRSVAVCQLARCSARKSLTSSPPATMHPLLVAILWPAVRWTPPPSSQCIMPCLLDAQRLICAAAGAAVAAAFDEEGLLENTKVRGEQLRAGLNAIKVALALSCSLILILSSYFCHVRKTPSTKELSPKFAAGA